MLKFTPDDNSLAQKGKVLLAEPFMDDPYFKRAAILLCEHIEEGTFGFVLNNYVDLQLDRIIPGMPPFPARISLGGPVNTSNLYYIHTLGDQLPNSLKVTEDLYMGGDFERLKSMVSDGLLNPDDFRFFIGYSGWSPGQLDAEIRRKSWFIADADTGKIMDTQLANLYGELIREVGEEYAHLADFSADRSLN